MSKVEFLNNEKQSHSLNAERNDIEFFLADDVEITSFRDEPISMEHPIFSLQAGNTEIKKYKNGNISIEVIPSVLGMATIHDKDIWIYAISKIRQAKLNGKEINQTIYFTAYDFLTTTKRSTSGASYKELKSTLARLAGTRISVDILFQHGKRQKNKIINVGLIDHFSFTENKKGKMKVGVIEITIPNWLFQTIEDNNYFKINSDYFKIRKPINRRIYELARKHCGNQSSITIHLDKLMLKTGILSNKRKLKFLVKQLSEKNDLPDYEIFLDIKTELVTFKNRNYTPKLLAIPSLEELKQSATYHLYESILFTFECLENEKITLSEKEISFFNGFKNKFETEKEITFKTKKQEEYFLGVLTRKGTLKNKNVLNEEVKTEKKKIKKVKVEISIDPDNHFLEGTTTGNKYLFENGYVQIFGAKYPYFNRDGLVCGCNDYEILSDLIHAGKLHLCEK